MTTPFIQPKEVVHEVRDRLIGHTGITDFLTRAFDSGRLSHAYLIVGPANVGKMTLARAFAGSLLGGESDMDRHPDFMLVERGADPKTGKFRSGIALDQIRELRTRLGMGAFMNGWRAAIVDDAHLMNTESANALLKTLEEPHDRTLLILLATSADRVMDTIRSRCQVLTLTRVPTATICSALIERGTSASSADLYARLADGRPGQAIRYAEDPDALTRMKDVRDALMSMPEMPIADRYAAMERLIPAKLPFNEACVTVMEVFDIGAELLRDTVHLLHDDTDGIIHIDIEERLRSWSARYGLQGTLRMLETLERGRALVNMNVNPRASLEQLLVMF